MEAGENHKKILPKFESPEGRLQLVDYVDITIVKD